MSKNTTYSLYMVLKSCADESTNHISLKKIGLDVTQSHPLHRTCFGQYQAWWTPLGWLGDRYCYLMHRMQSSGWPYSKASRSFSNALCVRAAVFRLKIVVIIIVMCCQCANACACDCACRSTGGSKSTSISMNKAWFECGTSNKNV